MSWIKEIKYEDADNRLKKLYDRVKGPDNNIDNILSVHSLRAHTLTGHLTLYKNVLHNTNNTFEKWYLETLGVYVSFINQCSYCVDHHFAGLKRLLNNEEKSEAIFQGIKNNDLKNVLDPKLFAGVNYAKKLTLSPQELTKNDFLELKEAGYTDGEVLEINQVISYFNYANRTVLGLGVNTEGDILGLSPNDNDDESNWNHS